MHVDKFKHSYLLQLVKLQYIAAMHHEQSCHNPHSWLSQMVDFFFFLGKMADFSRQQGAHSLQSFRPRTSFPFFIESQNVIISLIMDSFLLSLWPYGVTS